MQGLFYKGNYVDNPYRTIFEIQAKDLNNNIKQISDLNNDNFNLIVNFCPFVKDQDIITKEFQNLQNLNKSSIKFNILAFPSCEIQKINVSKIEMQNKIKDLITIKILPNDSLFHYFNKVYLNGLEIAEIYKYCLRNSKLFRLREGKSDTIKNDFTKFLVSRSGKVANVYGSEIANTEIMEDIEKLLNEKPEKNIKIRAKFSNYDKNI